MRAYHPGRHIGLSAAWNYGLRRAWGMGFETALVMNADISLADRQALSIFHGTSQRHPESLAHLAERDVS